MTRHTMTRREAADALAAAIATHRQADRALWVAICATYGTDAQAAAWDGRAVTNPALASLRAAKLDAFNAEGAAWSLVRAMDRIAA